MSKNVLLYCEKALFATLIILPLGGCSHGKANTQMASYANRQADIEHGEYEAKTFDCIECHTVRATDKRHLNPALIFAGGEPIPAPHGILTYSANVTVASQYPAQVLDDIIRGHATYKFSMPTDLYNDMSADDMRDLIAYLKTFRPILDRPLPDNKLTPNYVLPPPTPRSPIPQHEPATGTLERGRYLSKMFACQECHSPQKATGGYVEGQLFQGGGYLKVLANGHALIAPNITQDIETGIGSWSDAEIIRLIRTGVAKDGRTVDEAMPYLGAFYAMNDQDVRDLVRFLRTVPHANRSWASGQ